MDGTTQEFNLRTPRVRLDYQDPSTPEMPDLSFITQDICKVGPPANMPMYTLSFVNMYIYVIPSEDTRV